MERTEWGVCAASCELLFDYISLACRADLPSQSESRNVESSLKLPSSKIRRNSQPPGPMP